MTREILKEYGRIVKSAEHIKLRIEELRSRLDMPFDDTGAKKPGEYHYSQNIKLAAMISNLQTLYLEKLIELSEKQLEIESAVLRLPLREQILFRLKYIDEKTWEEIASIMNYSYQHVHRIHNAALKRMEEKHEGTCQ